MAEYVTDSFDYIDNGVVIKKQTWYDPTTGQSYDTFDTVGPAEGSNSGLSNGTVVNQATNTFAANQPSGMQGDTSYNGQRTTGSTQPQSGVSTTAAGLAANSAQSGGGQQTTPYSAPAGGSAMPSGAPNDAWSQSTGGAAGAGGSVNPQQLEYERNKFLYNPDNAGQSFDNILRDRGFNLGFNNPLTNMLKQYAPGLAAAFQINNVNKGMGSGDLTPDVGGDFAKYLNANLSGGGIFNTLNQARSGLGSAIGAIKTNAEQMRTNPGMDVNPYILGLQQLLEGNGGGNLAGVLRSLMSPMMTGTMGAATGQGLNTALGESVYQYGQPGGGFTDPNQYWLQQLYGGGR